MFVWCVHVVLVLQWRHQATPSDSMQAVLTCDSGEQSMEKDELGDHLVQSKRQ